MLMILVRFCDVLESYSDFASNECMRIVFEVESTLMVLPVSKMDGYQM